MNFYNSKTTKRTPTPTQDQPPIVTSKVEMLRQELEEQKTLLAEEQEIDRLKQQIADIKKKRRRGFIFFGR